MVFVADRNEMGLIMEKARWFSCWKTGIFMSGKYKAML